MSAPVQPPKLLRDYLLGRCTQAEAARAMGVSVRALKYLEAEAEAWLMLGLCKMWRGEIGADYDDMPMEIPGMCTSSGEAVEAASMAPRAASPITTTSPAVEQRAGSAVPRRWRPMR